MSDRGYGQFCPVAMATEVLGTRWTILVLRELLCGSSRFNELRRGVPRMSPALLSKRLGELEQFGIIVREMDEAGSPVYRLTEAGEELRPLVMSLGSWDQRWFESVSALGGTPDLAAEGLELVGTRQVDNGEMYEARYEDATGKVLRLFVAPDPQRHNELLYRTQKDGRKVVYWQQGPLMYALTGDFSERDLDGLAHTAIKRTGHEHDTGRLARTIRDTAPSTEGTEPSTIRGGDPDVAGSGSLQASQSSLEEDSGTLVGNGGAESLRAINQDLQTDYQATQ